MNLAIYRYKKGETITKVTETHDFSIIGTWMDIKQVTVKIISTSKMSFKAYTPNAYDYVEVSDNRYILFNDPTGTNRKTADKYEYSLVFFGEEVLLKNVLFRDVVKSGSSNTQEIRYNNGSLVEFYGGAKEFVQRMQANINNQLGEDVWKLSVDITTELGLAEKYFVFDGMNCWDCLKYFNQDTGLDFYITTPIYDIVPNTLVITDKKQQVIPYFFQQGQDKGLFEITKSDSSSNEIVTRLYPQGGDRNIPVGYKQNSIPVDNSRYSPFLLLPDNSDGTIRYYIDDESAVQKFGIRPKTEKFDYIFPSIYDTKLKDLYPDKLYGGTFPEGTIGNDGVNIEGLSGDMRIDGIVGCDDIIDANQSFFNIYVSDLGFFIDSKTEATYENFRISMGESKFIQINETLTPGSYRKTVESDTFTLPESITVKFPDFGVRLITGLWGSVTVRLLRKNSTFSKLIESFSFDEFNTVMNKDISIGEFSGEEGDYYILVEYYLETPKDAYVDFIGINLSGRYITYTKKLTIEYYNYYTTANAVISMRDGRYAGYDFVIQKDGTKKLSKKDKFYSSGARYSIKLARYEDSGSYLPSVGTPMAAEERFVILGIKMPETYVSMAENRLLTAALEFISRNNFAKASVAMKIATGFVIENPNIFTNFIAGNVCKVKDDGIGLEERELSISSVTVDYSKDNPHATWSCTLADVKTYGKFEQLAKDISSTSKTQQSSNLLTTDAINELYRRLNEAKESTITLVKLNDTEEYDDNNTMSSFRELAEFISTKKDSSTSAIVNFINGIKINGIPIENILKNATNVEKYSDNDVMSALRVVSEIKKNNEYLKELFLSKVHDDTAVGLIDFLSGINSNQLAVFNDGAVFRSGMTRPQLLVSPSMALMDDGMNQIVEVGENAIVETYDSGGASSFVDLADVAEDWKTVPDGNYSLNKKEGIFYPVKGGAGTSQYVLRLLNNLDSLNLYVVKNSPAYINFTFESKYNENNVLVDTNERGQAQISVRTEGGAYQQVISMYIPSNAATRIDVSKFITSPKMTVMVKVTGEISGKVAPTLEYNAQITTLTLSANNFSWWASFDTNPIIPMNIGGSLNKILHVDITGKDYSKSYDVNLGTTTYVETAYNYSLPHPEKTGTFNVSFYVKSADGAISTPVISFNIITIVTGSTEKLIAVNNILPKAANWMENNMFDYSMYDGGKSVTAAVFEVSKAGSVIYSSEDDRITTSAKQTFSLPLSIDTFDNSDFQIVSKVLSGITVLSSLTFNVDNSLGFSPTSGAVLYINPRTRSNNQSNYKAIVNEVDGSSVPAVWSRMNWGNDGWMSESGSGILRLFSGAKVDIAYKPFQVESARTGKTVEIDFKPGNVTDYMKEILTIASSAAAFVGLKIRPDNIVMHSQALKSDDFQGTNYKDDNRIRMTLTIMPDAYGNPGFNLCVIYINGVKNREFNYQDNDYFSQNGNLVIGSDSSDIDLYGVRVYDSALTSQGVLRNYMNWLDTNAEKERVQGDNDLLDTAGAEISYERVKDKLNTFVFDNTFPSLSNPNRYKGTLNIRFANNPSLNVSISEAEVRGQGTTSMRYWRWNLQWRLDGKSIVLYMNGSTTTGVWTMMQGIPAMSRITAKKNFASSMHSHKMGSVNSITDLYKAMGYTNEGIQATGKGDTRITVSQEPFVGFHKQVNEQGEDVYTFMGVYTLGADKGDANTFNYDTKAFPNLLAIEGSDNAPLCTLFRVPWNTSRMIFNSEAGEWQYNGANSWSLGAGSANSVSRWIPAYNLTYECSGRIRPFNGTVEDMNAQVASLRNEPYDFWIANAGDAGLYDVYYYEASEDKFIPSDTGSGTINLNSQLVGKGYGLVSSDLAGKTPEQLNTLFINARIQKFRKEAGNHFDINDAIFHHNWVEFHAGTDERAKNTYPYNFGTGTSKWKWRFDDTDTIFDTDNQGQPKKPYHVEVGDRYSNGAPVWNGETSNFWNLIDLSFPDEIVSGMRLMLSRMEALGGLNIGDSYGKLFAYFEKYYFSKAQRYFPINVYNADAKFTYETSKLAYIDGRYTNDTDPITQSMGDHYSAEQAWVSRRIIYMMSKYSYGIFAASGGDNITVRAAGNRITYSITPAIDLYPAVASGTSIIRGKRTKAGEKCDIIVDLAGTGDQQNTIQGASYLQDVGDWYNKNVTGSMIMQGRMLREIRLGSKTMPITITISALTISNCVSMQRLVLSRIATLGGTLNLAECTHLREVYADGTGLVQIILPKGGGLELIEYGSFNQYISLQNFPLLTNAGVSTDTCNDKITDFLISGCPSMNPIQMLLGIYNSQAGQSQHILKRIRCTGFDVTVADSDIDKFMVFADGSYNGLDSNGVSTTGKPVFEGRIKVNSIGRYQLDTLKSAFPELVIQYTILKPTPTTTFVFTSSQSKTITNGIFTCNYPFTKVNEYTYKVVAGDNVTLNITFQADNHDLFTANYVSIGDRTQPYTITYIPLRTIRLKVYNQNVYPSGATVVANGITYITDSNGYVYIRGGQAVSGTVSIYPYSDNTFNYVAILNDTSHLIDVYPAVNVKFTVKDNRGVLLTNAEVYINGVTQLTNIYGETVFQLSQGYYPYRASHPDALTYTSNVNVGVNAANVSVTMETKIVEVKFIIQEYGTGVYLRGATVTVDGKTDVSGTDGIATIVIPARSVMDYTITADNYEMKTGKVTTVINNISVSEILTIDIESLKPSDNGNVQMLFYGKTVSFNTDSSDASYVINWGDGTTTNATVSGTTGYTHTYTENGYHQIEIANCGNFSRIYSADLYMAAFWSIGNSKIANMTFNSYLKLEYVGDVFKNDANRNSMDAVFSGCSKLKKIYFTSFGLMVNVTSFNSCFNGCISLTSIPQGLFDNNVKVTSFYNCFNGCISLTSIPQGLFDNNVNVTSFNSCFNGCISLTSIPQGLFDNNVKVTNFSYCFYVCNKLTSIPQGLFDNNVNATIFSYCFYDCISLTSIPQGLFDNNVKVNNFNSCFSGCNKLTSIPQGLFDNNVKVTNFSYCFYQCSSLASIPQGLFDNNVNVTSFSNCFYGCSSLTEVISKITKIDQNMLAGCPKLILVQINNDSVVPMNSSSAISDNVGLQIKVPSNLVESYKISTNWNAYASKITAI